MQWHICIHTGTSQLKFESKQSNLHIHFKNSSESSALALGSFALCLGDIFTFLASELDLFSHP